MKKLTAKRCREKIEMWQRLERDYCLATTSEDHLQAYRIALPVLEQQEKITDSQPVITDSAAMITDSDELGDGWIEWKGGECPVDEEELVETKWSDEDLIINRAGLFGWHRSDYAANIIAYRVVEQERERGEEE